MKVDCAGLDVFERALQEAGPWQDDLMTKLGWADPHQAYETLGMEFRVYQDCLPLEESVHREYLGAPLPFLLRGLYYRDWDVSAVPRKYRHARESLNRVRGGLLTHRLDFVPGERVVQAVTELLLERLSDGELQAIRRVLPSEIHDFFDPESTSESSRRSVTEERA